MKSIITLSLFFLIFLTNYAQNKPLSVGIDWGKTSFVDLTETGSVFSPHIDYVFFKDKRVNLIGGVRFTQYRLVHTFNEPVYYPNGTFKEFTEINATTTDKYLGLAIATQIKLLDLDNQIVPSVGVRATAQREVFRNDGTSTVYNAFNLRFLAGVTFHKRMELSLFYDALLSDAELAPFSTGVSTLGIELNYLFSLPFLK